MGARRAALAAADLASEPGLRFWLARQRRCWRTQALPAELALMLQLAGVQLDTYSPVEWQAIAHTAAELLQGSQITLDLAAQQRRQAAAAAAAQDAAQQRLRQQRLRQAVAAAEASVSADASGAAAVGGSSSQPVSAAAAAAAAAAGGQEADAGEQQAESAAAAGGDELLPASQQQRQRQQRPPPPPGSVRQRAARWVQTQQALFAEGKLSPPQLRYMAFLGITWVLSDEVTHMREGTWQQWCQRLAAAPRPVQRRGELWEWLQHQRGLHALGWLPQRRRRALAAQQVRLDQFDRCEQDIEWDLRLSELLAYKAEHGHCRLPPPGNPAAAAGARQRWAPLAAWLAEQHRLLAGGKLPSPRATQLAAIGAAPPPLPARVAPAPPA